MRGAVLKILAGSALATVALSATPAAAAVTFDTTGSTLSCNGAIGCVQNTSTSVSMGGVTLEYILGSGLNIAAPSNINLGALDATGSGSFDLTGLLLTIAINQIDPAGTGSLPAGTLSGLVTFNSSSGMISWVNPTVTVSGYIYSVTNNPLSIVPPSSCIVPGVCGVTSIQGYVQAVPEPATWGMMLLGFAGMGFVLRRRRQPALAQIA